MSRTLLVLLLLLFSLYGLIHLPSVQTWLIKQVTQSLSKKLQTEISVGSVDLAFFYKLELEKVLVKDRAKDTILYAGSVKVDANDWFFASDKIVLHNIEIDDAVIHCYRKTEIWNYDFILDALSGKPTSSPSPQKGRDIDFQIEHISLNNFRYNTIDQWKGEDMIIACKKADIELGKMDAAHQTFIINSINTESPYFGLNNYDGYRPPELDTAKGGFIDPELNVSVKKINIKDGSFLSDQSRDRPVYGAGHFDETHIAFQDIQANINKLNIKDAILFASLEISSKERCGFELKKLKADMTMSEHLMEFKNLDAATNRSHLRRYYAMKYNNFKDDMNDFITNVEISGDFNNSVINSDDVAFFAPEIDFWDKEFKLHGKAKGTIDNFKITGMDVSNGATQVKGDLEMKGLPDIETTFILFTSEGSTTNYAELSHYIPDLKSITQPRLDRLNTVYFKGRFTGFLSDFVATGNFQTGLGSLTTDIKFKFADKQPPVYEGKLVTSGFELGKLTDNPLLGRLSLNGDIKGKGFGLSDLNTRFNGYIPQFEFNGYDFQQIRLNGSFINKHFSGTMNINDPNLVIPNLDGELTLSKKDIAFKLNAAVEKANLQKIKLGNLPLSISGKFGLDFTGNNIDNFMGEAKVYDAMLQNDSTLLSFNYLTLQSKIETDHKTISLHSDEIEAEISGDFRILELPGAFTSFLSKYYPTYIQRPSAQQSKQDFRFFVKTRQFENYLRVFDRNIYGGNNAMIAGNLNLNANELNFTGNIPSFGYDKKMFNAITLSAKGNLDTLSSGISIAEIYIDDSLRFPDIKLQLSSSNDLSDLKIQSGKATTINNTNIHLQVQTLSDGIRAHIFPSSFILKDKLWELEKDGEVLAKKNLLNISGFNLSHDNEKIKLYTEMDDVSEQSHLIAQVDSLEMDDLLPYFVTEPDINGKITGTAIVSDILGKPRISFKGNTDQLTVDGEYLGKIQVGASADTKSGDILFNALSKDTSNQFSVDGKYNYNDTSSNSLNTRVTGDKIKLSILKPYLNSVFSDIDGVALGDITIFGSPDHKYITGNATVTSGSFKVAYTQCRYYLDNEPIRFEKDQISLDYVGVSDSLKNTATINGKILHRFFDDFVFDNLRMESPKLLLLNTTKVDNPIFFGNVIGSARMNINGPLSNIQMDISGTPADLDTSHIYLSTTESKESNLVDYIQFEQFGTQLEENRSGDNTNIIVNLKINARPSCKVDVILDEETGDVIKGQGTGTINIRVGNIEPLSMRGTYRLTKGEYTFNFQTFFKKPFVLNSGGTITWNGDPYSAIIDLEANYIAKNVDISSLSNTSGFKQKEDITIVSHLSGILQNPTVKFDFILPEKSDARRDDIIVKRLADFKNDENEMNKQVASLLLFNTFIIGNQNFLSQGNASTLITNTIGGVMSNLLTNFFNRELEKATKGILSTYIDINPTLDLQKSASQLQANVRAGLKILLNNRLVMLVGGNLDYNNPTYTQQLERKGLITPDITVEWMINKDGSLRVVGFNRSSIDLTLNQRNRSGLQLSYRKDFNKLSDMFKKTKKQSEDIKTPTNPENKSGSSN